MTFAIFLVVAILLVYGIPKLFKDKQLIEEPETTPKVIKFFDGPLDGRAQPIMDVPADFYVMPYIAKDKDGNIDTDKSQPIGHILDKQYFAPVYAYYQQVTPEDYFYVRDLSEQEVERVSATGLQPRIETKDE